MRRRCAGRRICEPVENELAGIEKHLTAGLAKAERRTLLTLLTRVCDNAQALLCEWNEAPASTIVERPG